VFKILIISKNIKERKMKGIEFVVDDKGKKKAVLIDLSEWGELWEDFYDVLVSESRKNEPKVSWEELEKEIELTDIKNDRI
jgi:PHD/YefM family antitoxin component YafN of YafNO toxin-antitoxin module